MMGLEGIWRDEEGTALVMGLMGSKEIEVRAIFKKRGL